MKVLGIETATDVCAAAVVSRGVVLGEASLSEKYVHAERLMGQVEAVMADTHCSLAQIDGIAVSIGPGSFTGLRIGLSVAKGLSYAAEKRLVPVPTLVALARRVVQAGVATEGENILAAIDARRDEVYCQIFRVTHDGMEPVAGARDVSVRDLMASVPPAKTWVTGDASEKIRLASEGVPATLDFVHRGFSSCSAGAVGIVGEELLKAGRMAVAADIEPYYIKDFHFRKQP